MRGVRGALAPVFGSLGILGAGEEMGGWICGWVGMVGLVRGGRGEEEDGGGGGMGFVGEGGGRVRVRARVPGVEEGEVGRLGCRRPILASLHGLGKVWWFGCWGGRRLRCTPPESSLRSLKRFELCSHAYIGLEGWHD